MWWVWGSGGFLQTVSNLPAVFPYLELSGRHAMSISIPSWSPGKISQQDIVNLHTFQLKRAGLSKVLTTQQEVHSERTGYGDQT